MQCDGRLIDDLVQSKPGVDVRNFLPANPAVQDRLVFVRNDSSDFILLRSLQTCLAFTVCSWFEVYVWCFDLEEGRATASPKQV